MRFALVVLAMLGPCAAALAADLPDPKTAGAGGGPLAILFISEEPQVDAQYAAELADAGFSLTGVSYFTPMTPAFLKKFNLFVIDRLPIANEQNNIFGQRMLQYWANMAVIRQYVAEGAGLLVYSNLADCGGALAGGWNEEMRRYGIQAQQACILDRSLAFSKWRAYGENAYGWTENLAKHPVTDGLKRIYYPMANTRWDDCYTAPPLVCDASWTPIVKAMAGARVGTLVDGEWLYEPDGAGDLVLAAVRAVGKGRLGAVTINPSYIHRLTYTKLGNNNYGEMSYGPIDGIILKKGNGEVPSDTGALVSRLYAWLAAPSAAVGFGGYKAGDPIEEIELPLTDEENAFSPVLDPDTMLMPTSWRHRPMPYRLNGVTYYPEFRDPLVQGDIQFFKALVGAHSEYSDGAGSVEDYAAAAKAAGYSLIVFTENFARLSRGDWDKLVAACAKNSTDDFICLPGFDIMDPDNNHFILVAPPSYPRASWLSADGTRLVKTQMINLLWYNHMVVAHRPETSPLPYERLKHFQGLTVYTYRNGRVVDAGIGAYAWQVMNGSNPHPIVVHETFSPAEVAVAAKGGFQQLMPADTVKAAVDYFRVGTGHYFECPVRYLISEGPLVTNWVINPKDFGPAAEGRMHFRVDIGVQSDQPLTSVVLYDGHTPIRRWRPNATAFAARADFQHGKQYDLFLIAEDSAGRRVITSSMRTVAGRYHNRCADRQNWLGDVGHYYTGTDLPYKLNLFLPIEGTDEGNGIFTGTPGTSMAVKLNYPFTTNDVVLTESILDEKYVTAMFKDVGYDAMPSMASKPSSVYSGKVRTWNFTPGKDASPYPTIFEYDITLKRDVQPVNPAGLFPAFATPTGTRYAWFEKGKLIAGEITPRSAFDIPAGGMVGNIITLNDGLRLENGRIGLKPPAGHPAVIPAGTRFTARFIYAAPQMPAFTAQHHFDGAEEAWLRAMGFADKTPYALKFTRGKLTGIRYLAGITPANGGAAGEVTAAADIPCAIPLQLTGLNPRWPAGIWREGSGITYTGVFEGSAYPRLDVAVTGKFVAGNLLTADNSDLVLAVVKWEPGKIKVEVHNPTDTPIAATISTPKEITGLKALAKTVTVPAGTTVYIE
ncbi:MAG TPA: hypothetical protein PK794_05020, partial [Armatimonadota bacterium]|nr:hypothetical protein [Armatimonadota bacterium]